MPSRRGRKWAWDAWDIGVKKPARGNYATASALAALCFFMLLTFATVLSAVSPSPSELDEFPMLAAKRAAAKQVFATVYLPDCEMAALASIKEPFRTIASKTGFYSPEAFAPAMKCLDMHLLDQGLSSLDGQLQKSNSMDVLLNLGCVGDLRQTELCSKGFAYAQNKGTQIGAAVAERLMGQQAPKLSIP